MNKILLILAFAVACGFATAQTSSIFQISPIPMCWSIGGTDSLVTAYWLFSSREATPRVVSYLSATGTQVTVVGGTLSFGYCGQGGSADGYTVLALCDDDTPFFRLVDVETSTSAGDFDTDWQPYTPSGAVTGAPCRDLEYEKVCLLDSISPSNIVTFYRFYNIADDVTYDLDYELIGIYTPTGTVISCEGNANVLLRRIAGNTETIAGNTDTTYLSTVLCAYDSLTGAYSRAVEVIRTLVSGQVVATTVVELDGSTADLTGQYLSNCGTTRSGGTQPDSCECVYNIYQENHDVDTVFVDSRNYRVAYDVVTTRNCANLGAEEIDRQNLTQTFASTQRRQWFFNVTEGNFVDSLQLLFYNPDTVIGFTFNPAKVASYYPAILTDIDTSDLRCALGNLANMQIAIDTLMGYIIQEFITANSLGPVINYSTYSVSVYAGSSGRCGISIAWDVYNLPTVPYINIPFTTNPNYLLSGPGVSNGGQAIGETARATTGNYTACNTISTSQQYFFTNLSLLNPSNQIVPAVPPTFVSQQATTTTTTCTETGPQCPSTGLDTTGVIVLNNCLPICDTIEVRVINDVPCMVLNIADHVDADGISVTLNAATYNSIAIAVITGPVVVTVNGVDVTYPSGFSAMWSAPNACNLLAEEIIVNAAGGQAIISTLR